MSNKTIMLGNEAIARGVFEAGAKLSSAYPGTPSTEISEYLSKYDTQTIKGFFMLLIFEV